MSSGNAPSFPRYKDHGKSCSTVFHVFIDSSVDDDMALAARGYGDIQRYTELLRRPAFEFRLARGDAALRASAPNSSVSASSSPLLLYFRRPIAYTRRTHDYTFPWQLDETIRFFGRSTHEYIFDGRLDAIMLRDDDATGYVYVEVTQVATPEAWAILRPAREYTQQ